MIVLWIIHTCNHSRASHVIIAVQTYGTLAVDPCAHWHHERGESWPKVYTWWSTSLTVTVPCIALNPSLLTWASCRSGSEPDSRHSRLIQGTDYARSDPWIYPIHTCTRPLSDCPALASNVDRVWWSTRVHIQLSPQITYDHAWIEFDPCAHSTLTGSW